MYRHDQHQSVSRSDLASPPPQLGHGRFIAFMGPPLVTEVTEVTGLVMCSLVTEVTGICGWQSGSAHAREGA
jgi:hypothetical protein